MLKINKNCNTCYGRGVNKIQSCKTYIASNGEIDREPGFNQVSLKICGCVNFICPECGTKKNVNKMRGIKSEGDRASYKCLCDKIEIVMTVKENELTYIINKLVPKEVVPAAVNTSAVDTIKPVD